jgi:peptidoglycan/xylan/chitin deacetylase (PgdA/CDA1 family)
MREDAAPHRAFTPLTAGDTSTAVSYDGAGTRLGHWLARYMAARPRVPIGGDGTVSFSFDDFPLSSHALGAPILEAAGVRGTYYAATGLLNTANDHWRVSGREEIADLFARGHEIGLHTHSHRPVFTISPDDLELDVAENRAAIEAMVGPVDRATFAYPYGFSTMPHKRRMGRIARASRSVHPGLNVGRLDRDFILAHQLVDFRVSRQEVARLMQETRARKGWLVFLTHDVANVPSPFGCTPDLLKAAVDLALEAGLTVLPVRDALDHVSADVTASS